MTYRDICRRLAGAGIDPAAYEAGLLLERFCGVGAAQLPLCRDRDFDSPELDSAVTRRVNHYPLQYILGEWGFCGETYEVTPDCLIPRADTELLVETAAALLPQGAGFADLGCGSGCIAVSLLAARADLVCVAVDISAGALALTERNARRNGVSGRLRTLRGDILTGEILDGDTRGAGLWARLGSVNMIISNPPYIPSLEINSLSPELAFEPVSALDGGRDGLDFYRSIIACGKAALTPDGVMLFETAAGQTQDVSALAVGAGLRAEVLYDIEKRDRAVLIH